MPTDDVHSAGSSSRERAQPLDRFEYGRPPGRQQIARGCVRLCRDIRAWQRLRISGTLNVFSRGSWRRYPSGAVDLEEFEMTAISV
jgi:hypothetical protein